MLRKSLLTNTGGHGCRETVGELLSQVCSGVEESQLKAALQGLLAAAAHVRAAATVALLDVPAFAESKLSVSSLIAPLPCPWSAASEQSNLQTEHLCPAIAPTC